MTIRLCSPQLGLSSQSTLGGEIYDYEILKGLAQRGMKIEIILPKNRPYDTKIKNWDITQLPFTHIPAYLFNLIEIPYLFWVFHQRPFHILRLHAPYFTGIGAWFFRLFHPQVKLVATYHQARSGFIFDLINRLFIHLWDAVITDSAAAKQKLMSRFHVPASKITVIPGGAPTNLKPNRKRLSTTVTLLFMGLLIPRKNPLFLIKVVKNLLDKNLPVRLVICGSGPLKPQIKKLVSQERLQQYIRLHPPVFGLQKQRLYDQADIFVHPALHEGLPLVVLEALACGLPIVISHGYSAGEFIIDGHNGFLATTNQLSSWVEKLTVLINNPHLRFRLGKNSHSLVATKFTWKRAVQAHLSLFNALLNPHSTR